MKTMTLHWGTLDRHGKEEVLSGVCFNTRLAYYDWRELQVWEQELIRDNLLLRSKGTIKIEG